MICSDESKRPRLLLVVVHDIAHHIYHVTSGSFTHCYRFSDLNPNTCLFGRKPLYEEHNFLRLTIYFSLSAKKWILPRGITLCHQQSYETENYSNRNWIRRPAGRSDVGQGWDDSRWSGHQRECSPRDQ
jgi:hypothetical protein